MFTIGKPGARQKNLYMDTDHRIMLDVTRQYLAFVSESGAARLAFRLLAEQVAAIYAAADMHPERVQLLVSTLNATTPEPVGGCPWYQHDRPGRQILRWDHARQAYDALAPDPGGLVALNPALAARELR